MLLVNRILWSICRLKTGPQTLPASTTLLAIVVVLGIVIDSFSTSLLVSKQSAFEITLTVIIYNIILLSSLFVLLWLLGYKQRILQTLSAVAGTGFYISLVLMPGLLVIHSMEKQLQSFILLILIDNIWRIAVNAHIFHHAFSVSRLMAMILSVSYMLLGILLADSLLPAQTA